MQQQKLVFRSGMLEAHFHRFGNGPKVVLAFHGFDQTGKIFRPFAAKLGEDYSFFCMDLPFHGKTVWRHGEEPLEKEMWSNFIKDFLKSNGIKRYSLYGFSMGAKFAFAALEATPDKVDKVVLLAPDGIKANFWYTLATHPLPTRFYFRSLIKKPGGLFFILSLMNNLRIVDPALTKFVRHQMDTPTKREKVFLSWVVFRKLQNSSDLIVDILNKNNIKVILYTGTYDKIIDSATIKTFAQKLDNCQENVLKTGHGSLLKRAADSIDYE